MKACDKAREVMVTETPELRKLMVPLVLWV